MRVKKQGRKTAATMPKLFHTRINFLPTQVKACVRQGVRVPVGVRVYVCVYACECVYACDCVTCAAREQFVCCQFAWLSGSAQK